MGTWGVMNLVYHYRYFITQIKKGVFKIGPRSSTPLTQYWFNHILSLGLVQIVCKAMYNLQVEPKWPNLFYPLSVKLDCIKWSLKVILNTQLAIQTIYYSNCKILVLHPLN